jgi:hypothetical protein
MFKSIFVVLLSVASVTAVTRAQTLPPMRMTPTEIKGSPTDNNQIGSSGLAGVHTKVLFGDPGKAGFYSILLFVPAQVTIEAHTHRDNRVATVVSGEWRFGYGDHFDVKRLKTLPPGSVYSEPGASSTSLRPPIRLSSYRFQATGQPTQSISTLPTIRR